MQKYLLLFMLMLLPLAGWTQGVFVPEGAEIRSIVFRGNENIRKADLKDHLSIHSRLFKRWIRRGSPYNVRQILRDKLVLTNYYRQFGYLDVTVSDSIIRVSSDVIDIEFIINEGKQYYLNNYSIIGNEKISTSRYLQELKLRTNIPFSRYEIQNGIQRIIRHYETTGYPSVIIQDSVAIGDSVDFFVYVNEGELTYFGDIKIPELASIDNHVVQREVVVEAGDIYNIELIEESQRRLFETGLFNGVSIRPTMVDTATNRVDLSVQLIVSNFRAVDFEFGLKQEASAEYADPLLNLKTGGSWQHKNISGSGHRFQVKMTASTRFPEIYQPQTFRSDLLYTIPWLLQFRTPTTINPYYDYKDWSEWHGAGAYHWRYGVQVTTLYRWFRIVQAQGRLEWSKLKTSVVTSNETGITEQRSYRLLVRWDNRNNFFSPSAGYLIELTPKLAGTFLGGNHHFAQLEASYSIYHRLFWNVVGAARIVSGITHVMPQDTSGVAPVDQRFYLGGNTSVRGYRNQMLGPTIVDGGNTIPQGGNFELYGNFELRFPIYGFLGGEVFLDWGNLWTEAEYAKMTDIKLSSGFGITFATPIGPARVDFARPLNDSIYGRDWKIHVAISHAF
ncbi:MAG: BamA/TamA family outer membrane protein [Candidatus Marinimicrobia bacterium]|nr:BamA/TamA family outer membrane protein [Candidatus Neomarinimicrobiota bacterium]